MLQYSRLVRVLSFCPYLDAYLAQSTIRFVFKKPPMIVYTADFLIISSGQCSSSESVMSCQHMSDYAAMLSSSTVTSMSTTSSSAISRISGTSNVLPSSTVVADALGQGDAGMGLHSGSKSKGAASTNGRVDLEKFKFRMIFIVWPALVGVSMAL